jgi:uncharacterized protein YqjF (DUF2071 family)
MFAQESIAVPPVQESRADRPRPWRWSQHWRDLLFTHWRVPTSKLLPHLPAGLELDICKGSAWVSAVAFRLEGVRLRGLPAIGPCSNFLELNVRTYVRRRGEPAIYFLRIHAGSRLAVAFARWLTPLPYAFARISYDRSGQTRRFQSSFRSGKDWRPLFRAEFASTAGAEEEATDPLDVWLLERYCGYAADRRGKLYRMVVEHIPWRVRKPDLDVSAEGLGEEFGLDLGRQPDCWHVSEGVDALLWPFQVVRPGCPIVPPHCL